MLTKLIIASSKEAQIKKAKELLSTLKITNPHPDLLWIETEEDRNLGVKDARKMREFLSFKPLSAEGKIVVAIGADTFSPDAQNSLLKTLEEPPATATIFLTAASEENILETILSRVEIIKDSSQKESVLGDFKQVIEKLLSLPVEERFTVIERTEDKEGLLQALVEYTAEELPKNPKLLNFAKEVSEAEKFYKHQGNIRTILEYLMLCI